MGNVGGDPGQLTGGAQELHASGGKLRSMDSAVATAASGAKGAVGDPNLSGALDRFGAALSTFVGDTGVQLNTAAQLAGNAAADLTAATGGH